MDFGEFFVLFPSVFVPTVLAYGVLLYVWAYLASGSLARKRFKPVCYISYKNNQFNEDFEFTCDYCGNKVSSANAECPTCGGAYGKNKEYQMKRRSMHQRYLGYLKDQEKAIDDEMDNITETMRAVRRYKIVRHKTFNFDIGDPPVCAPADSYEFTCENCDSRIRGRSTDVMGCPDCGASYKENLELLVREEEDRLEQRHYIEYMRLRELEVEQNIKNERRDASVDEKYGKQINFMQTYGKYIALASIFVVMLISAGITVLIMKYR